MASDLAIIRQGLGKLPDVMARPIIEKIESQIVEYAKEKTQCQRKALTLTA
jgi:hypothetical protein